MAKRKEPPLSVISIVIAVLSLVVAICSFFVNKGQLDLARKAMKEQHEKDSIDLEHWKEQFFISIAKLGLDSASLKQMMRQTELVERQNTGSLRIQVREVEYYPRTDDSILSVNYGYDEIGKNDVIGRMFWKLSLNKKTDIQKWMNDEKDSAVLQKGRIQRTSFDANRNVQFPDKDIIEHLEKSFEGPGPTWSTGEMYIHIIYKYQDLTRTIYWTYMRWKFTLGWGGNIGTKATYTQPELVEIISWIAKEGEVIPAYSNLPQELK